MSMGLSSGGLLARGKCALSSGGLLVRGKCALSSGGLLAHGRWANLFGGSWELRVSTSLKRKQVQFLE